MPFVEVGKTNTGFVRVYPDKLLLNREVQKLITSKFVRLFLDEENRLIGIKPDDEDGNKVSGGRVIYTSAFGNYQGKYQAQWSKTHSMVLINLIDKLQ